MSALRDGLASIRRHPLVQVIAVGAIAVALLFLGLVWIAADNVGRLARSWGREVQATVYLEDGLSPARAKKIADTLVRLPGVAAARPIDSTEAYARLRRSLGERASLLDGVEEGLLPSSIELTFRDGLAGAVALRPELERLRRTPGVEDVELMGDWVDRLLAAERFLRLVGLVLGALVVLACVHVVGSTLRLGVFARREEIEVLQLVGASPRFVKAPFLVEGAIQGLLGAGVALGVLYGLYRATAPLLQRTLGSALASVRLTFLGPRELALAFALGAALGLFASGLAVGRHLDA
jgi:cell division transport system permease protein